MTKQKSNNLCLFAFSVLSLTTCLTICGTRAIGNTCELNKNNASPLQLINDGNTSSTTSNDPLFVIPDLTINYDENPYNMDGFGTFAFNSRGQADKDAFPNGIFGLYNAQPYEGSSWKIDDGHVALSIDKADAALWDGDGDWHPFDYCVSKGYVGPVVSAGFVSGWQSNNANSLRNVSYMSSNIRYWNGDPHNGTVVSMPTIEIPLWLHPIECKVPQPNNVDNPGASGHYSDQTYVVSWDNVFTLPSIPKPILDAGLETVLINIHTYTSLFFETNDERQKNISDLIELKYENGIVQMRFTDVFNCRLSMSPLLYMYFGDYPFLGEFNGFYDWSIDPQPAPDNYLEVHTTSTTKQNVYTADYLDIGTIDLLWTSDNKIVIKNYGGNAVLDFNSDNLIITKIDGTVTTGREWCACLARFELLPTLVTDNGASPICPPFTDLDYQGTTDFSDFHVTYWWWDPNYGGTPSHDGTTKLEWQDFVNRDREIGTFQIPIQTV